MNQERRHYVPGLTPKDTTDDAPIKLTHAELSGVHHGNKVEEMTTTTNDETAEEHTGNNREVEKEPEATFLLSGYGKSGTNPAEWFETDTTNCKPIKNYATRDLRFRVGENGPFIWIEHTGNDFRVYSCSGTSRNLFPATRGTGILPKVVEGVIIPFDLIKPESLKHLDMNTAELETLLRLIKEHGELKKREDEIKKNIYETEAKFLGKLRSKKQKVELEILQNQIEQKEMDINKARKALAEAEKGRPLTSYEAIVTSAFLKATQSPNSRTTEIPLFDSFSALNWFKKIQELSQK